jgi:hypothetical protein
VPTHWGFRRDLSTVFVEPPDGIGPAVGNALTDIILAEIGLSEENLAHYRGVWERIRSGEEHRQGISGNATLQRLDGGEVVLEALYGQWETVRIPCAQFEAFLEQFSEFLKDSRQDS